MQITNHQAIVIMAANRQEKAITLKTNHQKAVTMPIVIHHRTIHRKTHQKDKSILTEAADYAAFTYNVIVYQEQLRHGNDMGK